MPRSREDWTGIYAHGIGWRAIVSRHPHAAPLRRWFLKRTPIAVMQKWRQDEIAKWRLEKPEHRGKYGSSLAADVDRYLKHPDVLKKPTQKEFRYLLNTWLPDFGTFPRGDITSAMVRKVMERWATEPRSAKDTRPLSSGTVNRRVARLSNVYTVLDGRGAYNPCRGIEPLVESQGPIRDIPAEDLTKIIAAMADRGQPKKGETRPAHSKTKARVMVLATTGLPPSTLKKLRPEDVDLPRRLIYRPVRNKGEGVAASPQPITQDAVTAFKAFARLNCWGSFSQKSLHQSLLRAAKAAGITRHIRPYDLRHTFLSNLAKTSGDEVAVMDIAQHADIRTTRRYTRGSISLRAKAAIDKYEQSLKPKKRKAKKRVRARA